MSDTRFDILHFPVDGEAGATKADSQRQRETQLEDAGDDEAVSSSTASSEQSTGTKDGTCGPFSMQQVRVILNQRILCSATHAKTASATFRTSFCLAF